MKYLTLIEHKESINEPLWFPTSCLHTNGSLPSPSQGSTLENDPPHVGELDSLEEQLSALPLRREAGDGPHFDLNAGVELLVPHVPHSLDGRGYCFVLQGAKREI